MKTQNGDTNEKKAAKNEGKQKGASAWEGITVKKEV